MNEGFFRAHISEMKQGFGHDEKDRVYYCLFCNQQYEEGEIYRFGERLCDAHKAAGLHVEEEHGSVFLTLISEDKKLTGLTDTQKELMTSFYHAIPDKQIAKETHTSPATVRYQRFNLREKAKQARVFLALSELMEEKIAEGSRENLPKIHAGATMVDERYMVTDVEEKKIIDTAFQSVDPLVLKIFPVKQKKKLVILRMIAQQFARGKKYSEKQIDEVLKVIYSDHVTIRRYLIEYGFLDRTVDCKEYWVK